MHTNIPSLIVTAPSTASSVGKNDSHSATGMSSKESVCASSEENVSMIGHVASGSSSNVISKDTSIDIVASQQSEERRGAAISDHDKAATSVIDIVVSAEANETSNEEKEVIAPSAEPQESEVIASKSSAAQSQSLIKAKSQTVQPAVSIGTMLAKNIVQKAMEMVMQEILSDKTLEAESTENTQVQVEELLTCSSEEYLTMAATELVRNAIAKVQKDLESVVSSSTLNATAGSEAASSKSMFSFMKLPSVKSIRKIFSF